MATVLHRDDPEKEPLVGHVKVTREDWVNAAREVLIDHGVGEVKVLGLSAKLGVSRSSFYWYFKGREALLEALLQDWAARNTTTIIAHCRMRAANITEATCNFFRCFLDPALFDSGLDFAVREWARREARVRARIDAADAARIEAVTAMYRRFGYPDREADARARILYFMQLGYHALDVKETIETRLGRVEAYLKGFNGCDADPESLADFMAFARARHPD